MQMLLLQKLHSPKRRGTKIMSMGYIHVTIKVESGNFASQNWFINVWALRWLILASYCFSRISNALWKQGGANIYNVFWKLATCLKQNTLLIFKTRFKCFKHVAHIQNTLLMFQTRREYLQQVAKIPNAFLIFKTRFKCFKRVANIRNTFLIHDISNRQFGID